MVALVIAVRSSGFSRSGRTPVRRARRSTVEIPGLSFGAPAETVQRTVTVSFPSATSSRCLPWAIAWLSTWISVSAADRPASAPSLPFEIEVTEKGTGWPVPQVELETVHHVRFVSDNAGVVAFDLPELMGQETWLTVLAHGYEVPADGFGYRGVRVTPSRGGKYRLEVIRTQPARLLGRLTGAGLFGESQKLGRELQWTESGVLGCDSVQNAVWKGRMFWAWGDTLLARYPLGVFDMTGATTPLHPLDRFEPPLRLHFEHFRTGTGTVRGIAKMPGAGPTWISGVAVVPDTNGVERLVATYQKIQPPLDAYEIGLCVWNEEALEFDRERVLWRKVDGLPRPERFPDGHPFLATNELGQVSLLFGNPFPTLGCPPSFEAWRDPSRWETLHPPETLGDVASDNRIRPHSGSVAWNAFRRRWVTVFMQAFGSSSAFGELWYAEANSPVGPWGAAVRVATHTNYTCYNPRLHPEFTPPESPVLLFEATFTRDFADRAVPVPRHDYNQVLYRLDLADPALARARVAAP